MAYLPHSLRDSVARRREQVRDARVRPRPVAAGIDKDDAPTALQVPWSVRVAAEWSWRMLVVAAAIALGVIIVVQLRHIVIPVLVAVVLTVFLHPMDRWLRRRLKFPRAVAALATLLGFLAIVTGVATVAGRGVVSGFADLGDRTARGFQSVINWLATSPIGVDRAQVEAWIDQLVEALQANSGTLATGALSVTTSIGSLVAGTFLVFFLTVFFLMDGRRIWMWVVRIMPRPWRDSLHESTLRGWVTLRGYVRATIAVALIDATGIGLGAALLGVPLALPLAILVFLGSFVPIVGALVSGSVAVLVALVDQGPVTALAMLAVVLGVQQLESHVLQPFIMGSSVSLHPVAVLLGVAGGTYVAGIAGAVFTVPVMAFLNTAVLYLSGHDKFPELATDTDRPGGPPGTLRAQVRESYGYHPEETEEEGHAENGQPETEEGWASEGPPSPA